MNRRLLICVLIILYLVLASTAAVYGAGFVASAESHITDDFSDTDKRVLNFASASDHPITLDRFVQYALSQLGYTLRTKMYGMGAAMNAVDSGEMDGICQLLGVESKHPELVRVKQPVGDAQFNVYVRQGNRLKAESWEDLAGMRVGVIYEKEYILESLPEDAEVYLANTGSELLNALLDGEFDVAVLAQVGGNEPYVPKGISLAGALDKQPIYIYLNKAHKALVPQLEKALEGMDNYGVGQRILEQGWLQRDIYKKTFLFINSYDAFDTWGNSLLEGVKQELVKAETNEIVFVNTSSYREAGKSSRDEIVSGILRSDMLHRTPDVIIASDNRALEFVKENYYTLYKGIPVVYGKMIDQTDKNIHMFENDTFEKNFTAVEETLSGEDTVDGILKLFPNTKNIFVINDYTPEGMAMREKIQEQMAAYDGILNFAYSPNEMFSELLERISLLPEDAVILCGSYSVDSVGAVYSNSQAQTYFADSASRPIFGLIYDTFGYGQLGGMYMDSETFGRALAAEAISKVGAGVGTDLSLQGGKNLNKWIFDSRVMLEYGISRSNLPAFAEIINERKYFYTDFSSTMWMLFAAALLFPAGALALLLEVRRQQGIGKRLDAQRSQLYTDADLKLQDAEIQEVKSRFAKIISGAPVGFVVTSNGIVQDVNKCLQDETGIAVGKNISAIYADDQERVDGIVKFEQTGTVSEVIKARSSKGRVRRYLMNGSKSMYNGELSYIAWCLDIEDIESQKDLIRQTQEDLQKVLSALPIALTILEPGDMKIIYGNNAFVEMFGYDYIGSMLMRSLYEFYPGGQNDGQNSYLAAKNRVTELLRNSDGSQFEWQYLLENGKILHTKTIAQAITYRGERKIVCVLQDIGYEREQAKALYEIAERERQANQAKSRFLVSMSHEIRTPMNGITGLSEIAMHKHVDKEDYDVFKKINISAKNLLAIINDILDFSKIEAEELDIVESEFDIEEVIANALLMASQRIGSKNIELLMKMEADVPVKVITDKTRLWQVLKNLLDNAAKYTEQGKIRMRVENISHNLSDSTQMIRFTIEDTGMGMTPTQLAKVFMPYEQFHNARTNRLTGTGLGMTITKQLTELMGGKIEVESEAGKGTVIRLTIPLKIPGGAAKLKDNIKKYNFNGMRVLAVDDDEFSLDILSSLLEEIGVELVCAKSGDEGLNLAELAQAQGNAFQVIILDYMMPGMTGIEVAQRIHLSTGMNSKLLMVSAYAKQLVQAEIESAGFDDVLEKPFCPSEFIQKLGAAMEAQIAEEPEERIRFNGARVLLCEDNLINQDVAIGMLGEFGIEPVIAANGQEGLDILDAAEQDGLNQNGFHLVLMDILMPVMDGHTATQLIRASNKPYSNVPIVAMTANVMQDEIERCKRDGMNGHIGKPVSFDVLYAELVKWIPKEFRQEFKDEARSV